MKRLRNWLMPVIACLVLCMMAEPVVAAQNATLCPLVLQCVKKTDNTDQFDVYIQTKRPVSFAALDVSVEYDTSLLEIQTDAYGMTEQFQSANAGATSFCYNNQKRGSVYFTGASTSAVAYSGAVGRVTFTIKKPQAGGVASLRLRVGNLAEHRTESLNILNPVQQYWLPIGEVNGTYGDVDRDGRVTMTDAWLALKAAMCTESLDATQAVLADIDQDAFVSLCDVQSILRMVLGLG